VCIAANKNIIDLPAIIVALRAMIAYFVALGANVGGRARITENSKILYKSSLYFREKSSLQCVVDKLLFAA
jgi:hypothetical protein